jgi:hypothetical protein
MQFIAVRYLAVAMVLMAWPGAAAAQHRFSLPSIVPALPSIAPPLPAIGLQPEWRQHIPWEQPRTPAWEQRQLPPWEQGRVAQPRANRGPHQGRRGDGRRQVIYIPYPVAVQQEPQIIVVQQPPVTRIVQVEVPAPVEEPLPADPPLPPYVPSGDRTLYLIPGCYVGNVPPVNLNLPANCDRTKLVTYVP